MQRFALRSKAMSETGEISAGRWSFVPDIVPQSASAYDDARNAYIEQLVGSLGPLAVYEYGRVGAPGISDIDLLVVVDPEKPVRRLRPPSLDPAGRYLIDKPVLLSPEAFRNLRRLLFIDPLDHLFGRRIDPLDLPEDEARIVNAGIFLDFSHVLLHRFNKMRFVRRLSIRNTLLRLNSIHHSASLAERVGAELGEGTVSLLAAVRDLRGSWFEEPRYDVAAALLEQAVPALLQLLEAVTGVAEAQHWSAIEGAWSDSPVVQIAPTSFSLFSKDSVRFNEQQDGAGMGGPSFTAGGSSYNLSASILCLPRFAYLHLLACSSSSATIPRVIRRRLGDDTVAGTTSRFYQQVIGERMRIASECWDFLDARNLFGFGQFPPCGIVEEFLRPRSFRLLLARHLPGRVIARFSRALARRDLRRAVACLRELERS